MKQNDNKQFWERVAKLYTPLQEKGNKELYQQAIEYIKEHLSKDMNVLEIASGTGQFTFPLCDCVAQYEATDFSKKMINESKKIRSKGITYSVQDATQLTYNDNHFDAVIIANALHIMPNPSKALNEIYRVLKNDGIVIAPTFIYEGKMNKFRLWIMEKAGFKTFHKWTKQSYTTFIQQHHFEIIKSTVLNGNLLPECIVIARRK